MTSTPVTSPKPLPLVERLRATQLPPPSRRREIRQAVGATLRDIALEIGVGQLAVSQWERGLAEPKPDHAIVYRRLLDALVELDLELKAQEAQK